MPLDEHDTKKTFDRWLSDGSSWVGVFENKDLSHPQCGHRIALVFDKDIIDKADIGTATAPDMPSIGRGWRYLLIGKYTTTQAAWEAISRTGAHTPVEVEVSPIIGQDLVHCGIMENNKAVMLVRFETPVDPQLWNDLVLKYYREGAGWLLKCIAKMDAAGFRVQGIFNPPILVSADQALHSSDSVGSES